MEKPNFFKNLPFEDKIIYSNGLDLLNNSNLNNTSILEEILELTMFYCNNKLVTKIDCKFVYYKQIVDTLYTENQLTNKIYMIYKIFEKLSELCFDFKYFDCDWDKIIKNDILKNKYKNEKFEYKNNSPLPFKNEIMPEAICFHDNWTDLLEYKKNICPFNKESINNIREKLHKMYNYKFDKNELLQKVEKEKENLDKIYNYKNKTFHFSEINQKVNDITSILPNLPYLDEISLIYIIDKREKNKKWWSNVKKLGVFIFLFSLFPISFRKLSL
jgi:hypothetical protein